MKTLAIWPASLTVTLVGMLSGCAQTAKTPDAPGSIRIALDQAGFKNITIAEDRGKGVITLGGHVSAESDKSQAESLAKSFAGAEVVADQIAVLPLGAEADARTMNSDLDRGIEQNLDAALIQSKLRDGVRYAVKSGVVTLTGEVDSQSRHRDVATVTATVPNVRQVVNELQVKNQKASSSE